MKQNPKLSKILALGAAVLILAACGQTNDTASSSSAPSSSPSSTVTGAMDPSKI